MEISLVKCVLMDRRGVGANDSWSKFGCRRESDNKKASDSPRRYIPMNATVELELHLRQ